MDSSIPTQRVVGQTTLMFPGRFRLALVRLLANP